MIRSSRMTDRQFAMYVMLHPVSGGKKGRSAGNTATTGLNNLGAQAGGIATADQGIQSGYRGSADPFAKSLIPTANGALSPYAASQFGQEKQQIGKTYNDLSQVGLKQLGNRGLAAPGSSASIINTDNANAGAATTGAYNTAMQNTLGQGLAGINYMQGQQQIYNPNQAIAAATGAYGGGIQGAKFLNGAGSTLGDIGAGLSGIAGLAV
jgi:hypothetical protein